MRLGNRYELVAPIASGGMAQVWSAVDLDLDREVAAKILHPHLATDDAFVERFRREAVAAAGLSHESIVSVYDTVSTGGTEAIVMELIEGRTLRAMLDEVGALPVTDVVHLGGRIASALDAAHRAGVVHRDIKPANIMVCPDRRVMVTDFGIAKAGTDADLTTTGTLLGTAKYLSPEQVSGEAADPRSDLYSLGVVMFEALTGTVPFKANTDAATALARLHQPPPRVRQVRPNVPDGLEAVIDRLMARDIRDRFPRAIDVADALAHIDPLARPRSSTRAGARSLDGLQPPAPPPGTRTGPPSAYDPVPHASTGPDPGLGPGIDYQPPTGRGPGTRRSADHQPPTAPGPGTRRSTDHQPPTGPGPNPGLGRSTPGGSNGRPTGPRAGPDPTPPRGYAAARPPEVGAHQAKPPVVRAQEARSPVSRPERRRSVGPTHRARSGRDGDESLELLGVDRPGGGSVAPVSSERVRRSRRSRWFGLAGVVVVIGGLLVGAVAIGGLGNGDGGTLNPFDETGPGLSIVAVTSFDPQTSDDTKEEREELTPLAIDGDPATAWMTENYRRRQLGGLKDGVGLLLMIEEPLPLNQIELVTNTTAWEAEVYVGERFSDVEPAAWGLPAATVEAGSNRVVRPLDRAVGDVVLIWITDTGESDGRFRFELAEVVLR